MKRIEKNIKFLRTYWYKNGDKSNWKRMMSNKNFGGCLLLINNLMKADGASIVL